VTSPILLEFTWTEPGWDAMSESAVGAGATMSDDGTAVVLVSVWWKNPFLWMALGIGIPMTIMPLMEGDRVAQLAPGFGVAAFVLTVFAHLSLRARLEIRPDGFREDLAFWRTIEHGWADVDGFMVRTEAEASDAVGFWVREGAGKTAKFDILMGGYGESVRALTDRMNAARDKALAAGARTAAVVPPR